MTDKWRDLPTMADVAAAQAAGDEIQVCQIAGMWNTWSKHGWMDAWQFRARHAQPKMKKVNLLAWLDADQLFWLRETSTSKFPAIRVQSEDKIIEVME